MNACMLAVNYIKQCLVICIILHCASKRSVHHEVCQMFENYWVESVVQKLYIKSTYGLHVYHMTHYNRF